MWVFIYKFDEDGWLEKYKARLVVRRDLYQNDQQETYAATLATRVFRTLIVVVVHFDLDIFQLDAVNTFINALLDKVVHIKIPEGYSMPEHCFELKRTLYGLPRSPLLWFNELSTVITELGLQPVPEYVYLFTNRKLIVFFYIDDICVLCHPSDHQAYEQFRIALIKKYEMREMG